MSESGVIQDILNEVKKAVVGKDEVVVKLLLAFLAFITFKDIWKLIGA